MFRPWFERDPRCLEYELQALEDLGIQYSIREAARTRGVIVLDLKYPRVGEGPLSLIATYPDNFPYFRPEVSAPDLALPRHQDPFQGTLCLLPRPTRAWDSDWTLAELLNEQVPKVLEQGRVTEPEDMTAEEQAEPVTDYYPYNPGSSFLIDPPPLLDDLTPDRQGRLLIGMKEDAGVFLKGAVVEIQNHDKGPLARLSEEIVRQYPRRIGFRWVRLDRAPDQRNLISEVRESFPTALVRPGAFQPVKSGKIDVLGVVFPEEYKPGRHRDGWLFLVRCTQKARGGKSRDHGYLARAARVDTEQFGMRAPELLPLRESVVAIVGAGCIGAPSALEFARAGIREVRLLDHDVVDAGATMRWPFGLTEVGELKVAVLARFIAAHYPRTRVVSIAHRIGTIRNSDSQSEGEVLRTLFEGVSLLYDASAEGGVSHFLSHRAREVGVPYVAVAGRQGGWGGTVMRDGAGITDGCWGCFGHHLSDGGFEQPPYDPSPDVQPAGCADPTFTGANFDLGEIALTGVRLSVATLCRGVEGGYPDYDWDVGILALRTPGGRPIAPSWRTYPLTRHEACGHCN